VIRDHLTIGLQTYMVLLEDNNLGEPPTVLGGGDRWYPDEDVAHRRANAYNELKHAGLFRQGRVDDEFLETVHVMQRPGVEHYTFATINDRSFSVRIAATGKDAVLMVASGERIDLYPAEPEQLPEQLYRALPECNPAAVHSMACDPADYQAALGDQPVSNGSSGRDAKQILRWTRLPRERGGQLFTAVRKNTGGRNRCTEPPRWFDTDHGRILIYLDPSGYMNVVPGTLDKFAGQLHALESGLRKR